MIESEWQKPTINGGPPRRFWKEAGMISINGLDGKTPQVFLFHHLTIQDGSLWIIHNISIQHINRAFEIF